MKNFQKAIDLLKSRNYVDYTKSIQDGQVLIAPAYGVGRTMQAELEKLATKVEFVPTRRSTPRKPRTLPVYYFAA